MVFFFKSNPRAKNSPESVPIPGDPISAVPNSWWQMNLGARP